METVGKPRGRPERRFTAVEREHMKDEMQRTGLDRDSPEPKDWVRVCVRARARAHLCSFEGNEQRDAW